MSGHIFPFEYLPAFIRHEIGEIQRYFEEQRQLTVLYFHLDRDTEAIHAELEGALRECDAIFHRKGDFFLVLPGTDKEGGLHVGGMMAEAFDRPVNEVAATWPEDGNEEHELMSALVEYARHHHALDLEEIRP
ncbi:hypothetical protein SAMN05660831_00393 [Thiohalospira halophila DSM 15071]|uniref:Uncharacterized protein n=1 Tax=Thiohalospira halophila DSM 15071 TaxID=1123397 RepID=A0A1I1NZ44_9GAMM|nr:hypothetical protein [Thiohalospira halophila]SFD00003.1 hypothetical protein SAMN05660831_00393 [Thiohalospira halophila DSM 15071]